MKENVDLTVNRVFRGEISFGIKKYPYKQDSIYFNHDFHLTYDTQKDNGFIFQGNEKERKSKKEMFNYYHYFTCERCGSTLFPYHNGDLCYMCEKDLETKSLDDLLARRFNLS